MQIDISGYERVQEVRHPAFLRPPRFGFTGGNDYGPMLTRLNEARTDLQGGEVLEAQRQKRQERNHQAIAVLQVTSETSQFVIPMSVLHETETCPHDAVGIDDPGQLRGWAHVPLQILFDLP